MDETELELTEVNLRIPSEENDGNRLFFEDRLAAAFALRRANGAIDSREMYLLSLRPGGQRTCDPGSIKITLSSKRAAIVQSIVESDGSSYLNIRLFIKDNVGMWRLLGWANERA